ncbi:MAG: PHP domain-containing protein [Candidatus Thorarchaeota archaeon]|nr:PHP domain-containing protein [Candidatus Thorarchaeota archaeon]
MVEFSAFDLHTHTIHSKDGLTRPKTLFSLMKKHGLRGIAVTEHLRPSFTKPIVRGNRFLIPGCEYKSTDYGEIIGLFITEPVENRSFEEIAEDLRDQNAITILPHPRDPLRKHTAMRRGLPERLIVKYIDLIEGFNSRCILPVSNKWAQRLAKRLHKPMTAGSDGHSFLEIGHAQTWLQNIETVNDIYEELKAGRTQISGWPSFPLWQVPTMLWQRVRKLAQ